MTPGTAKCYSNKINKTSLIKNQSYRHHNNIRESNITPSLLLLDGKINKKEVKVFLDSWVQKNT